MRKFLFLLLTFLFFLKVNTAHAQNLGNNAEISLLTCSPGGEIYSLFGHSAVRVKDPTNGIDYVFNYGIFDFDTPNFTVKFIQGKLLYKLGVSKYRNFDYQYRMENRQVIQQVFNLDAAQKQAVFDFLMNNARPENRDYKYDFFYDNCSSRIADVLQTVLGDNLTYTPPSDNEYTTYRNLLDYYVDGKYPESPWTDFGMDLILGLPADEIADLDGETFLPDFLSENFTYGKMNNSTPLVQPATLLIPKQKTADNADWSVTPLLLFWILCGLTGLLFLKNNNAFTKWFDFIFFLLLGLSGCLFIFMWVGTDHEACYRNMNMLWMNPLHLLLAINILRNKLGGFWKKYLWFTIFVNVLLLVFWKIFPQEFHAASLPILLIIMMRAVALLKFK